jgi:hypothetical protein
MSLAGDMRADGALGDLSVLERVMDDVFGIKAAAIAGDAPVGPALTGDVTEDAAALSAPLVARLTRLARGAAIDSLQANAPPALRARLAARRITGAGGAAPTAEGAAAARGAAEAISKALVPLLKCRARGGDKAREADAALAALNPNGLDALLVANKPQLVLTPRALRALTPESDMRSALQDALDQLFYQEVVEVDVGADEAGSGVPGGKSGGQEGSLAAAPADRQQQATEQEQQQQEQEQEQEQKRGKGREKPRIRPEGVRGSLLKLPGDIKRGLAPPSGEGNHQGPKVVSVERRL